MIISPNEILWAKINENAIIPTKDKENAGYDIYPCFEGDYIIIQSGETKLIPTGIACGLNENYYLQLEERGSTGSKGIKRSAGVIDSGYRGEIFVAITNCNKENVCISKLSKDKLFDMAKYNIFGDKILEVDDTKINLTMNKENNVIFYPYNKAICQGIVHTVPDLISKEVSYQELCNYTSKRGIGKLGSSYK